VQTLEVVVKDVKVLGPRCANCKRTYNVIEEVAKAKGVQVQLEKVEDVAAIAGFGVMATPGVVIDGKVVHMGGVPARSVVEKWFS
jgi:small redox-active disulfide protein 2